MPVCVRFFCTDGSLCMCDCLRGQRHQIWVTHLFSNINPVIHARTTRLWLMLTSSHEPSRSNGRQQSAHSLLPPPHLFFPPADRAGVDHHLHCPLLLLLLSCFVPVSPSLLHLPPALLGQIPFLTWFYGLQFRKSVNCFMALTSVGAVYFNITVIAFYCYDTTFF